MLENQVMPYLPIDTPIELPNDLPVPSTSRVLGPRSRATSLARSEARSASGSRPSSRASSTRSKTSSSSRQRLADVMSQTEAYSMPPSSMGDSLDWVGVQGLGSVPGSSRYLTPEEASRSRSFSQEELNWGETSTSTSNATFDPSDFVPPEEFNQWSPNVMVPDWPMTHDFSALSEPTPSSSSSHGAQRQENSESYFGANFNNFQSSLHLNSWIPPIAAPYWQTGDSDSLPSYSFGLDIGEASGSGSGTGGTSSKRKRSPSDPPADPLSQRSWRTDTDAEREVASQLLFDDGTPNSLSQLSSVGISSQEIPVRDRKGKGKARERGKTPDPASVIVIPDTPPTSHKEVPVKMPTKPKPDPLSSYTCPICFSPPTNATLTPCGHICCGACLFAAVKTTMSRTSMAGVPSALNEAKCPVCRATIPGWDGKGAGVIGLKARAIFRL
ncbi:hypothetical protein GALMADRAFT_259166 [Galerina marginata CBS 339.88]|uniref:RING-type domain-containing protein n=1 Tax=Galerina marginata (strain CBS 339.88) TaxID=685588 RepID=A0A067S924_GALM3|nr:hypothetical protein GALMADRAFT_259166 [Galerina marginata CBS 339.88]